MWSNFRQQSTFFNFISLDQTGEGDHLGDRGVDGRIILKWIFKKWDRGTDWIQLAQDRDRWRAAVNAVMNLRVP
jgi:hypothetical protein